MSKRRVLEGEARGRRGDAPFSLRLIRESGEAPGHYTLALSMYLPSLVSTVINSPISINGGTCTTRPVSSVAGLFCEAAVAPLRLGSVSTTRKLTLGRHIHPHGLALIKLHGDFRIRQ